MKTLRMMRMTALVSALVLGTRVLQAQESKEVEQLKRQLQQMQENFDRVQREQKQQIEAALGGARAEFALWAKENLRRDGPEGETVARYVLPMDQEVCGSLSNRLMSVIADSLGSQRAELFRAYSDTWFQIEMGYLGGVTNTLSVLRQPSGLCYELRREGPKPFGQMSEGPGLIDQKYFPPAWRNIFPGGWAEVSQREGFELPQKQPR